MNTSIVSRGGVFLAAVAALAVAGCGGSKNDELPLIRATVSVKTVSYGGTCETVPVRMTPKALSGLANKYANDSMMVVEIATTGPTDENGAPMCNGTGETLPMASGNWEFSAALASGIASCVRMIEPGGDLSIVFVDGIDSCGGDGNGAEAMPAEGDMPAEGEAPAEPAAG